MKPMFKKIMPVIKNVRLPDSEFGTHEEGTDITKEGIAIRRESSKVLKEPGFRGKSFENCWKWVSEEDARDIEKAMNDLPTSFEDLLDIVCSYADPSACDEISALYGLQEDVDAKNPEVCLALSYDRDDMVSMRFFSWY